MVGIHVSYSCLLHVWSILLVLFSLICSPWKFLMIFVIESDIMIWLNSNWRWRFNINRRRWLIIWNHSRSGIIWFVLIISSKSCHRNIPLELSIAIIMNILRCFFTLNLIHYFLFHDIMMSNWLIHKLSKHSLHVWFCDFIISSVVFWKYLVK